MSCDVRGPSRLGRGADAQRVGYRSGLPSAQIAREGVWAIEDVHDQVDVLAPRNGGRGLPFGREGNEPASADVGQLDLDVVGRAGQDELRAGHIPRQGPFPDRAAARWLLQAALVATELEDALGPTRLSRMRAGNRDGCRAMVHQSLDRILELDVCVKVLTIDADHIHVAALPEIAQHVVLQGSRIAAAGKGGRAACVNLWLALESEEKTDEEDSRVSGWSLALTVAHDGYLRAHCVEIDVRTVLAAELIMQNRNLGEAVGNRDDGRINQAAATRPAADQRRAGGLVNGA